MSTSIRLPEGLEASLEKVCKLTKKTKSSIIKHALEEYILDVLDGIEAERRLKSPNAKFYTHEEVLERLKKRKK